LQGLLYKYGALISLPQAFGADRFITNLQHEGGWRRMERVHYTI
jgi:hypothetical protein